MNFQAYLHVSGGEDLKERRIFIGLNGLSCVRASLKEVWVSEILLISIKHFLPNNAGEFSLILIRW